MTWPLVLHVDDHTSSHWGDAKLTAWILSWDAHVLATDPTDLFQAPMFHPERDALAYTEHLITLGLFAAPIIWVTGNPVLAQNLIFLLGLSLAGLSVFFLARELMGDTRASIIAGSAYVLAPYWFGHAISLSHVQAITSAWLPLAILGTVRWIRTARVRPLVLVAGALLFGTLTSWYMGAFVALGITVTALIMLLSGHRRRLGRLLAHGLLAIAVVLAGVLPFTLAYRRVQQRDAASVRSVEEAEFYSANLSSFLSAPGENRLYGGLTKRWRAKQSSLESTLFPGAAITILAGIGLFAARRKENRSVLFIGLVLSAVGVLLSFGTGPSGIRGYLPWAWLQGLFSLFRALRTPARFHVLTILGLAILAGLGMRALLARIRSMHATLMAVVICALVIEAASSAAIEEIPKTPAGYEILAARPGAVLELPTFAHEPRRFGIDPIVHDYPYLIYQIGEWYPLVNGIGAHFPEHFRALIPVFVELPAPRSIEKLRREGIRTLILHRDRLAGTPWQSLPQALASVPEITLLFSGESVLIYDIGRSI